MLPDRLVFQTVLLFPLSYFSKFLVAVGRVELSCAVDVP